MSVSVSVCVSVNVTNCGLFRKRMALCVSSYLITVFAKTKTEHFYLLNSFYVHLCVCVSMYVCLQRSLQQPVKR